MSAAIALFLTTIVPLALDGESISEKGGDGTAIAIISVVSMAGGYLLLFALWRYVFSAKARAKRGEPPD
jgi:hypothetical protein